MRRRVESLGASASAASSGVSPRAAATSKTRVTRAPMRSTTASAPAPRPRRSRSRRSPRRRWRRNRARTRCRARRGCVPPPPSRAGCWRRRRCPSPADARATSSVITSPAAHGTKRSIGRSKMRAASTRARVHLDAAHLGALLVDLRERHLGALVGEQAHQLQADVADALHERRAPPRVSRVPAARCHTARIAATTPLAVARSSAPGSASARTCVVCAATSASSTRGRAVVARRHVAAAERLDHRRRASANAAVGVHAVVAQHDASCRRRTRAPRRRSCGSWRAPAAARRAGRRRASDRRASGCRRTPDRAGDRRAR